MATKTVRLNDKYQIILEQLAKHYDCNTSTIIKKALQEMYEDMIDRELVEDFEKRRKEGKEEKYYTSEEMLALCDEIDNERK